VYFRVAKYIGTLFKSSTNLNLSKSNQVFFSNSKETKNRKQKCLKQKRGSSLTGPAQGKPAQQAPATTPPSLFFFISFSRR
jgi:hypothetical protein